MNHPTNRSPIAARFGSTARTLLGVMLAVAWLTSGCSMMAEEDPNTFRVEGRPPSPPPGPVPGTYGYPPEPPVTDSLALHDFVGKFQDRVVLLDFWASWSQRSRAEMPRLIDLQRDLRSSGFQVISCNLDDSSQWSSHTTPFLKSISANFPCVVVPRSAKGPLRSWLGTDWDYSLPARFLIGPDGAVLARMTESASIDQVVSQCERAVRGSTATVAERQRGGLELRLKLIDVNSGDVRTFPTVFASTSNPGEAATRIAENVTARLPNRTQRIAILPICSVDSPARPTPFGQQVAEQVAAQLRRAGYLDLIEPAEAARRMEERQISMAAIEFDPAAVRGQIDAEHAVFAWLAGGKADASGSRRADAYEPGDRP